MSLTMRIYTLDEIERTRAYFERECFSPVNAHYEGLHFRYYRLPPNLNPELQNFVFRMTSSPRNQGHLFGISTDVPEFLQPYWVRHEVVEFLIQEPGLKNSCLSALEEELKVIPPGLHPVHVPLRRTFFDNLMTYATNHPADFSGEDIAEFQRSLDKLRKL